MKRLATTVICLVFVSEFSFAATAAERPNVVLVLTDDQGYGDIAALGNPMIRTPNLDRLHARSVRLTNFHVDPTCAPTRAALMTGRYSTRTGVWHTIQGRSLMSSGELTLAEIFAANGYRTGMFGKWHLGDNAPLRPQDQGFQKSLHLRGGGIGQSPDFWGNDYFDDVYYREDGSHARFTGYCTDVWFREGRNFMERARQESVPFFCYIATNAPHSPYLVAAEERAPYTAAGVPAPMDAFYGMITNIDTNLGRLIDQLEEWKLTENTILIFMTDNGTAAGLAKSKSSDGWTGFNSGMRGTKGSQYDGGHRVPCFLYWPAGGLCGGRDVPQLTAHIDILPTLVELCSLQKPSGPTLDGVSLASLLRSKSSTPTERTLFVHSQRVEHPQKNRQCSVMTERWRLVDNQFLFDIEDDPSQARDVSSTHPDVVHRLKDAYDQWWQSLTPVFDDYVRIDLGNPAQNPTPLCCHDWHTDGPQQHVWNQEQLQKNPQENGFWAVNVAQAGRYRLTLRLRPEGVEAALPQGTAHVTIGDLELQAPMPAGEPAAVFETQLPAGPALLQTRLDSASGESRGAYYVDVLKLE
jgi:arylsulfatase A-like enzyme